MKKQEFLRALKKRLSGLSKQDVSERLNFYNEMIDDRMEEGLTEEEAVTAVGDVHKVANQIITETREVKRNVGKPISKKLKAWEIVLLIVGSPLWLPILIAVFAVFWSLIITLWVIELPFLIFYYISKYLFVVCKKATILCFYITKKTILSIKDLF